jgi:hypothetical protein
VKRRQIEVKRAAAASRSFIFQNEIGDSIEQQECADHHEKKRSRAEWMFVGERSDCDVRVHF